MRIILSKLISIALFCVIASLLQGCSKLRHRDPNCSRNLLVLERELERYASENKGKYPPQLWDLCPNYIQKPLQCKAATTDTYSPGYSYSKNGNSCEVFCTAAKGAKTRGAQPHYAVYSSQQKRLVYR